MFYNAKSTSIDQQLASVRINHDLPVDSLTYTAGFASYNISYDTNATYMMDEKLNAFKSFSIGFTYIKKMRGDWNGIVSFQPQLVSNFESTITLKDIQPIVFIGFSKRIGAEKLSIVKFGIQYDDFFGKPSFLPDVSFSSFFTKKIAYTIGFPVSEVVYKMNSKNGLKAAVSSNSFYSRVNGSHYIQKDLADGVVKVADLQFRYLNAGLEYQFMSDAHWGFNLSLNHSFSNDIKLRDQNDNNINIGFKNGINFSMGFKYNLNFK